MSKIARFSAFLESVKTQTNIALIEELQSALVDDSFKTNEYDYLGSGTELSKEFAHALISNQSLPTYIRENGAADNMYGDAIVDFLNSNNINARLVDDNGQEKVEFRPSDAKKYIDALK